MKNVLLRSSLGVAIACVAAGVLLAQQPPQTPQNPPPPSAQQRADDDRGQMVTVTGCLKEEKDVPGAKPNVAERAGVTEDFILTQARMTKGGSTDKPDPSASPSGGSTGKGAMYKVSGLDDEKLRAHANQQVEVQGRLIEKTITGAQKPTKPGPDTPPDEVQEIRATSIKSVASACKAGTE